MTVDRFVALGKMLCVLAWYVSSCIFVSDSLPMPLVVIYGLLSLSIYFHVAIAIMDQKR